MSFSETPSPQPTKIQPRTVREIQHELSAGTTEFQNQTILGTVVEGAPDDTWLLNLSAPTLKNAAFDFSSATLFQCTLFNGEGQFNFSNTDLQLTDLDTIIFTPGSSFQGATISQAATIVNCTFHGTNFKNFSIAAEEILTFAHGNFRAESCFDNAKIHGTLIFDNCHFTETHFNGLKIAKTGILHFNNCSLSSIQMQSHYYENIEFNSCTLMTPNVADIQKLLTQKSSASALNLFTGAILQTLLENNLDITELHFHHIHATLWENEHFWEALGHHTHIKNISLNSEFLAPPNFLYSHLHGHHN